MFEMWKQLPLKNNKNSPHEIFKMTSTHVVSEGDERTEFVSSISAM